MCNQARRATLNNRQCSASPARVETLSNGNLMRKKLGLNEDRKGNGQLRSDGQPSPLVAKSFFPSFKLSPEPLKNLWMNDPLKIHSE